jgi:hypothetical protein
MEKNLAPLTQFLKKNNKRITFVLLSLILFMLFPLTHFVNTNIKQKVEKELRGLLNNPWIKILVTFVVLSVYYTGDLHMLVLTLYLLHHILMH